MDDTTIEALEFPAILKELSGFCLTSHGKERALALVPFADAPPIDEAFREYFELSSILKESGNLPLGGAADLRPLLLKSMPPGAFYLPEEMLTVLGNLSVAALLKAFLTPAFEKRHILSAAKLHVISDEIELYRELGRILDDKGQIKDDASPELRRIRREMRTIKERARGLLDELLKDKTIKDALQEELVTIRDDRYVFMIKSGSHTAVHGIIHGQSGSGATYFIEPMQLVEINNRLAIIGKDEKEEEIRILKEATRFILEKKEPLLSDVAIFASLDSIQAKALFSEAIKGSAPLVKAAGGVKLRKARHPILVLKEAREGGRPVIPIEIIINENTSTLVISGANTGGKTVALKTLGLLTLMALSGIPIPVDEGSEAIIFTSIFADIGDRQDIIASLSTFSAHVKRLKEFLALAGKGSLILIDEIGVGTDPSEGSALALAALETFKEKGAITVVTTHHNLLKAQAQIDPAYMNASVEFDESSLQPLYRLHYGIPGPSLGLMIAESLGIPSELISRARLYIKEKEGAFIESVRMLEEEKEKIGRMKAGIESLEIKWKAAVERLTTGRELILKKARDKADLAIEEARMEFKEAIEKLKAEKEATPAARARAEERVRVAARKALERLGDKREPYVPAIGDKVVITDSNAKCVVLRVDSGARKAELQAGNIKVWVDFDRLEKKGEEKKPRFATGKPSGLADVETRSSINVIGMRVDEALPLVTRFLDDAHAAGLDSVEIIHGIGTGALSKAIHEILAKSGIVKKYHHADPKGGGGGVTVVEMA